MVDATLRITLSPKLEQSYGDASLDLREIELTGSIAGSSAVPDWLRRCADKLESEWGS